MEFKEIVDLKTKGIMNLDNAIYISGYDYDEVIKLKEEINKKGFEVEIIDTKEFSENLSLENCSLETKAINIILYYQKLYDMVIKSTDIFLILNIENLISNEIYEMLSKSNPQFLVWCLSYQIQFNAICHLNKSSKKYNLSIFEIKEENNILEALDKAIIKIEKELENFKKDKNFT